MNVKKLLFKTIGVTFLAGALLTGCNFPKGSASESGGTSATDQQPDIGQRCSRRTFQCKCDFTQCAGDW